MDYSTDDECENKNNCKLMKLVNENQRLKKQVKELKKELAEVRQKMSYMEDPTVIGTKSDMG